MRENSELVRLPLKILVTVEEPVSVRGCVPLLRFAPLRGGRKINQGFDAIMFLFHLLSRNLEFSDGNANNIDFTSHLNTRFSANFEGSLGRPMADGQEFFFYFLLIQGCGRRWYNFFSKVFCSSI